MKYKFILLALFVGISLSCTLRKNHDYMPSWNNTPVKQQIMNFIDNEVDKIPIKDRIAVFDMDGTLVCERPWGIETVVSIHRFLELGEKDPSIKETIEYQYAKKLNTNPRDTSVTNHFYDNGQNYRQNIIMKAFDGADSEEYIEFANKCLNTQKNADYDMTYANMFYQPMLEFIEILKKKQFKIFIVSGSMQGIVWSICPQILKIDRLYLLGNHHAKDVTFKNEDGISYTIKPSVIEPSNHSVGKAINIYDHIGKIPVIAVGNSSGDFGMFRMVSCSPYPHLSLLLHHDDAKREYVYSPHSGNWEKTLQENNWLQADMSKEFKIVWKK